VFEGELPCLGEDEIKKLQGEREITRFQIFGNFIFSTIDDLKSKKIFNENIDLWLYKPERMYKFNRKISLKEWIVECREEDWRKNFYNYIPPIISNVKVDQEIRRTWMSNEEIEWLQHKQFEDILNDEWKNKVI